MHFTPYRIGANEYYANNPVENLTKEKTKHSRYYHKYFR